MRGLIAAAGIFAICSCSICAQETSIPTGPIATEHFHIQMEIPWKHRRPSPKETAVILEQFYSVLDRYFGRAIAARKHQILESLESGGESKPNEAEKETETSSAKKPKKDSSPPREIPKIEHERIAVHFLNDKESFLRQQNDLGESLPEGVGGVYFPNLRTMYLHRSSGLLNSRTALLHETVHAYQDVVFPGQFYGYPSWFCECMSAHLEDHSWDGRRLNVNFMPPFTAYDKTEKAFRVLRDMKIWVYRKQKFILPSDTEDFLFSEQEEQEKSENSSKKKKRTAQRGPRGTIVDSLSITEYCEDRINFQKLENHDPRYIDTIHSAYALYWVLGKYLFLERRKELVSILSDMSADPALLDKTDRKATKEAFHRAFTKAFEKKPITIEELGRWLSIHQPKWRVFSGEWQFTNHTFLARAEGTREGKPELNFLLHQSPNRIPPFRVRTISENGRLGLGLNVVDRKNYNIIEIHEGGQITFSTFVDGAWKKPKKLGVLDSGKGKNSESGAPEYQFVVKTKGSDLEVSINGRVFHRGFQEPNHRFGLILAGKKSEAEFLIKPGTN